MQINIQTAEVFEPCLTRARYKALYGGRGSGKSHFCAEDCIDRALSSPGEIGEGLRFLCFREIQKSLKESAKFLIESKLKKFRLGEAEGFKVFADKIALPRDGVVAFTGMQDHTAESIKSYEGFHVAWGEEAHTISAHSLTLLRPTIRWEDKTRGIGSELWFSWNPRRKSDAVDALFRGEQAPSDAVVVKANWSDNPWFPSVLDQERRDCLRISPELYDHVWDGGYATITEGAYYSKCIAEARLAGRIGRVAADPLMSIRLFFDIGGTGAKADAATIWAAQFIGKEVRVIDYYEVVGQPLSAHVDWMRSRGYTPDRASIYLPHDGSTHDKVYDVSFESALSAAGYSVEVIPNQGSGAARMRIECARRMFPACWFDEAATKPGLDAIGWYHERWDITRNIGLGPEHDWASHGADSFGLMCICAERFAGDAGNWGGSLKYPSMGVR